MPVRYDEMAAISGDTDPSALPKRELGLAIGRGLRGRCPNCGKGRIFKGYTTVNAECTACGQELFHHRADDFPPYITIVIVGHIIIAGMFLVERAWHPAEWIHLAIWLPLTLILSLTLLPIVKGGVIGLQWALYMHGFDPRRGEDVAIPDPAGSLRRD
ncbi:MAG: DUF983 domain-containing protein [Ancalomicrobiaceae bacterium]|nr:DUF983 domain-containing protein [Ancalomicrobiaceae bacterium]